MIARPTRPIPIEINFVLYPEALALKTLGFDEYCLSYFLDKKLETYYLFYLNHSFRTHTTQEFVSAPLYQEAFAWFYKKHRLFAAFVPIQVETSSSKGYRFRWAIMDLKDKDRDIIDESMLGFYSPEEAHLSCLQQLIKIIKEKSK